MRIAKLTLCLTAIHLCLLAPARAGLGIGDRAPDLAIAEWVQGGPIDFKKDVGKKYYLVEFWATWCPPCKMSVPLLNDLQKKHAKDLDIIGITSLDDRGNSARAVKRFVKSRGDDMIYPIAIDKGVTTTDAYLVAAGVMGIPHAFLVGKDGRIVWQGSPLEPDLADVIAEVVAGRYDVKRAKAKEEVNRRLDSLNYAAQLGRWSEVWDGLIGILQLDPSNDMALGTMTALYADGLREEKDFRAWAAKFIASNRGDFRAMERLAMYLFQNIGPDRRMPDLALTAAHAAYKASNGSDPASAAALALVAHDCGDLDRAIALQTEAVSHADTRGKPSYQAVLDYFTACKALQGDLVKLLD